LPETNTLAYYEKRKLRTKNVLKHWSPQKIKPVNEIVVEDSAVDETDVKKLYCLRLVVTDDDAN
jgi:hypothetical protein